MMAQMRSAIIGGFLPFVTILTMALALAGCASGPLGSHGVDYIPAFETGPEGVGS
jgi:hypothetical protein